MHNNIFIIAWYMHACMSTIIFYDRGIENIQSGIGPQAGNIIKDITTFLVGIVWAFTINWKLALVATTLLPIVSLLGSLHLLVLCLCIRSITKMKYVLIGLKEIQRKRRGCIPKSRFCCC